MQNRDDQCVVEYCLVEMEKPVCYSAVLEGQKQDLKVGAALLDGWTPAGQPVLIQEGLFLPMSRTASCRAGLTQRRLKNLLLTRFEPPAFTNSANLEAWAKSALADIQAEAGFHAAAMRANYQLAEMMAGEADIRPPSSTDLVEAVLALK